MINKTSLYTAVSVTTLSCMLFGCNLFGATDNTTNSPAGGISVSVDKSPTDPSAMDQTKMDQTNSMEQSNVLDIINSNPNLSTLAAAIRAAGLESTLQNGDFTIFAPNNRAFDQLPAGALQNLLKPENRDKLRDLILFHVVNQKLKADDLKSGDLKTADGKDVKIDVSSKEVSIGDSKVTKTDIVGSNGVIHIIDAVLTPQ